MTLMQQLLAFIDAQLSDRKIDNMSWNSCAVGDFAREQLDHVIPAPIGGDFSAVHRDPIIIELVRENGSRYRDTLDVFKIDQPCSDHVTLMDRLCDGEFKTYGALQNHLAG